MRPNIIVSSVDLQRLEDLLDSLPDAQAAIKNVLLDELSAQNSWSRRMPPNVVFGTSQASRSRAGENSSLPCLPEGHASRRRAYFDPVTGWQR
jgi:hypothetical protein